ncbi:uncharacterized protein RSE6_05151 [Rhynchosporium secalis]|uniref:Uncharacterized protein n=1 Tax=Rhynchosporium secalis TaxID=38038 RepID=A0A1E1M737_RHYSE|nr:uncharacterized protein RSE6_05151 [Rhynchosporium secalis]
MDAYWNTPSGDSSETLKSDSQSSMVPAKRDESSATKRGRKGHAKSRTGCKNCKRARIKYDFLLHAMLALAAADISAKGDEQQLRVTAMAYRVKSIESLNRAIESGIQTFIQGNAMLATCFALLFQSVFIQDGLGEYMSFIRGTLAIGTKMGYSQMKFLFVKAFGDEQLELIGPALSLAPLVHPDISRAACKSLEKFGFMCEKESEALLYGKLLCMARNLVTSSQDAYMELRNYYGLFMFLSQEDFVNFIDPANIVGRLIQAHFVSVQLIMTPITNSELMPRQVVESEKEPNILGKPSPMSPTAGWLRYLHSDIPSHMVEYFQWTLWVEQQVQNGKLYTGVYN